MTYIKSLFYYMQNCASRAAFLSRLIPVILIIFSVSDTYSQNIQKKEVLPVQGIQNNFVLKVGYFDFPGLTYTDRKGKPAGFVNEITIKTLENAKIKYTIDSYPAARFYKYLSKGRIHLFNGLSTIPIVKESTISSDIEVFPLEMRLYYIQGSKPVTAKEDLAGHSVILIRGFTYKDWGSWIRDDKNKVNYVETNLHESAFEMLKRGRAEYLLNYKYIDSDVLSAIRIPDLVIKPLFRWNCFFNIHKNTPDAEKLLKKIEDSYKQLIKNKQLKQYE